MSARPANYLPFNQQQLNVTGVAILTQAAALLLSAGEKQN